MPPLKQIPLDAYYEWNEEIYALTTSTQTWE